ncbi:Zinc finger protein 383 [Habropoda laboriosa]|uniref:Zinc finger protein 383 n=1 Tax=Habropoda laboriosa TaxID=597456 RepID=A0A0L7QYB0_9HYME|nr:Zinc finger protein 383 [Habropoda laboriosa]
MTEYFDLPINMNRICRICLTEGTNLSSIFCTDQEVNDFSGLPQKIQVCGSIEIHEQDGLPSLICDICIYKASVAHEFRQQCQHSDAKLRMYYNKPAKTTIMDAYTQTESEIRTLLPKKQSIQEDYFVKEEMQITSNSQEYIQSCDSYCRNESSLSTSQIDMQNEKLFICSIGFEGSKEMEKEPCISENNVNQTSFIQESNNDIVETVDMQTKPKGGQNINQSSEENDKKQVDEFLDENILNDNDKEDERILQKRTSARKVKSVPNKTYSEDEIDDNYCDSSNDDQDSGESKFKCKVCSKCYSTQRGLKKHSLVHGKKHKCNVCSKMFYKLENMENHKKIHASKPLACQLCHACFSKPQSLRRHVSMHKPKAEPVTCEICGKVCASQARLVLHQRTHKPKEKIPREYLCHICSKVYPSNSSLTYHMRTHTGIKPHVCKTCNSGFTTTTSLANHIRIHTGDKPFVCHVCSAAFAVSSAFRRHLTRHTGEANYLCKTCGKAFKRLSTLKEHTYTHSGEKPYVCKTCGAAYSHSGSLFAHQKRCRAQYGEMVVDEHHHTVAHHIHVNNVQSAVRSLAVIGQMF